MITRFRPKWDEDAVVMESCGDGDYVRHIDHAERIAALEAQVAEVEEYLPPESPAYQSMGERAKLLKDQMQYAAESSGELGRALAALEAQAATAIAMRDLEERNKIDSIQQLERSEARVAELEGSLPGRMKGCQALADEKCRCFLLRAEGAEAQNQQLRDALQTFVDHFGDPFKTARAALAATEPKPVREVSKPQSWGFSGYLEVLPDTATEPPAQTSSIESTYRERE